ncbi:argininosuccinate lyase [Chitinophaga nivalis]|uniref:Argininosuccinate lyase n=1 Tax=Chitinophaga nivalis TaxID=2991709 RepID=A0ABT3IRT0_9BACT|nr:argininosuccinate lyase [Chitinophaga nivalis]MCW3463633.1 argininosuccinate lyase [Chitinophaga nivalis]MCW3486677.1 argininosuccinate lyase [Chitinophaga nivalis]
MKLWQKDKASLAAVEQFTVGKDREMDTFLAPFDVLGSMAHITMLESIGLLGAEELTILKQELRNIYQDIEAGNFKLEADVEDIHSQVELLLTRRLGEVGKKIHSGRSRNDQVLVDLKLFLRHELQVMVEEVLALFRLLQQQSEAYKNHLIPGYTHLQIAMPSSFGLWFGAYAESLVDDLTLLQGAYKVVNKNPLGSAAGYGSSFPLDRELTTALLGFDSLNYNVVYAQMGRGKTEKVVAFALSGIAATIAKMAMDACLFMNQNFGFISFPDELTTGSSIMPHKKNPDVWELIRSHGNKLQALPNEIAMMITNLPSGYHRDLQLLKENLFPAFQTLKDCIRMSRLMLENIRIREHILDDDKYQYLFSVEVVNNLVLQGTPFREAYKQVGLDIEQGVFSPAKEVNHTHAGSIGNLCTAQIAAQMDAVVAGFPFDKVDQALEKLLQP